MEKIQQSWAEFKTSVTSKNLAVQYTEDSKFYYIFASENGTTYKTSIYKETPASADQTDFETNYKSSANAPINPLSPDRKIKVVSSSLPQNTNTCFTTRGDNVTVGQEAIFGGKRIEWDFSTTDDDDPSPPAGYKRKIIEFEFLDSIYVKEGTIYFHDAPKGSYVDFYVVCKAGNYYLKNDGTPALAAVDTKINHYVTAHPMTGSVPMGDELNTEQAMEQAITPGYMFRIEVTTLDTDSVSHGVIEIECYRERTIIL